MRSHSDQPPFSPLVTVDQTGSTNTDLVRARLADPQRWPHLSALRARHQVAGRGRAGRRWQTPADEALTVSILLVPERPMAQWASLTTVTALALVSTLRRAGLAAAWKWPNDVVLTEAGPDLEGWGTTRKVAGILAEVVPTAPSAGPPDAVVIGVGVNVAQRDLPVEWATSLRLAGWSASAHEVLDGLGRDLADLVGTWQTGGFAAILPRARTTCDTLGRWITVRDHSNDRSSPMLALDLDSDAHLKVRTGEATRVLAAGEVSQVRRSEEA